MLVFFKRDFYELRRNFIFYFAIFSLFPIITYLLLVIPLSFFIFTEVRYLNWSAPGIWVVCSVMASFFSTSIRLYELKYETKEIDAILATPITNSSFLISILVRGLLFGMIQFIFSLMITSFLNNEYFGVLNLILIFAHILIIVSFFSILGAIIGLIIKNIMFLMQFSIALFMFLSLGMDLFIPIEAFPDSYSIILNKFPLITLFKNIQFVIIHGEINWLGYFITLLMSLAFFFITLAIYSKALRKI